MLNSVSLVGRLVADPELKYTPNGVAVCTLRLAVGRRFKSASGERETDFFDIICWRQTAEFAANYLAKGRQVAIHGELQQRSWTQPDGQKRYKIEVVADNVQGLGARGDNAEPSAQGNVSSYEAPSAEVDVDMDYDPFNEE